MQPATAMSRNAPESLKTIGYTDTISLLFNNYKGIMREISERVIDCESLIDLICDIDYALPCTFPVIFRVETGVYLSDSSFSGRQFRVNNSLPLMDGEGNPIKFDDDDEEE